MKRARAAAAATRKPPAMPAEPTKGPWNCDSSYTDAKYMPTLHGRIICIMGDVDVAYVANHGMLSAEEVKANARLLAASWDLREVLKECALLFAKGHAISRFDWGGSCLRAQDIRELNELPGKITRALAKAGVTV